MVIEYLCVSKLSVDLNIDIDTSGVLERFLPLKNSGRARRSIEWIEL